MGIRNFFIIILLVLLATPCFAQNTFFIGEKTYASSDEFVMKSKEMIGGINLNVLIANDDGAGLFIVSTKLYSDRLRIRGKLLIYLDDKTIITCIDKGKYDYVNKTATTIYHLTPDEIDKLKVSNIYSVRFSIASLDKYTTGPSVGDHSVINYPINEFLQTPRINFPSIFSKLF